MSYDTPDILKKIVAHKQEEVAAARAAASTSELMARISDLEDVPRGFERHLREASASNWTAIIAEVKKGSPEGELSVKISTRWRSPRSTRTTAPAACRCSPTRSFFSGTCVSWH